MTLSEKIHQLRKGRGLSQEELALQLTVSRQAISKWELGESVPDTENVIQISKLFGVSTDYLLLDAHEVHVNAPVENVNDGIAVEAGHRIKTIMCGFLLASIIALTISTVIWVQNWQSRGIVSALCFLMILSACFYVEIACLSKYASKKQTSIKRMAFYSIAVWFVLPIPIWAVVYQAKFHYPRPFLYGMQYLAFIGIYGFLSACLSLILLLLKKIKQKSSTPN